MGVYFKQLGLNGAQAGVLSGIRPLVEYICAPMWVNYAERTNRGKTILLTSLACWILFTFPLGSIQPEPVGCIVKLNQTHAKIFMPEPVQVTFTKREAIFDSLTSDSLTSDSLTSDMELFRFKRAIPKPLPGISPIRVSYAMNYDPKENINWISPTFSSQIFKKDDVTKVFFLLLLLVIFGEALSSPSIILADSAVLHFLGDEAHKRYGHQRMFGSIGWAISMFFIGIALDHSTFPNRKCQPLVQVRFFKWIWIKHS